MITADNSLVNVLSTLPGTVMSLRTNLERVVMMVMMGQKTGGKTKMLL